MTLCRAGLQAFCCWPSGLLHGPADTRGYPRPPAAAAQLEVMEVGSRELFLLTGDVDAVVVYLDGEGLVPLPHQLAAALREGGVQPGL